MPERIVSTLMAKGGQLVDAAMFALLGIAIGIAQMMARQDLPPTRIIVGRALSTGGLATAAGGVLVWVPDLPLLGQMGIAAALASLGTSGLERMFQRAMQGRG